MAAIGGGSLSATLIRQRGKEERDDRGNLDLSYLRYIGRQWFAHRSAS